MRFQGGGMGTCGFEFGSVRVRHAGVKCFDRTTVPKNKIFVNKLLFIVVEGEHRLAPSSVTELDITPLDYSILDNPVERRSLEVHGSDSVFIQTSFS